MRVFDRVLQRWRARVARRWVRPGANVLDIGCHQGEFLHQLGDAIGPSVGMDPLATPPGGPHYQLVPQAFREPLPFADATFDAVVMLATLEHITDKAPLARECYRLLRPAGRVILTVPSPWVDLAVMLLCRLRLADGMSLDEHHGFDPRATGPLFAQHGFTLECWRRFQLGLNHLFIFRKPSDPPVQDAQGEATKGTARPAACPARALKTTSLAN
jgi:SAM-dependent methyltransferase